MSEVSYPFTNTPVLTDRQWSNMGRLWLGDGVVKGIREELLVYADSTGMRVKMKAGSAWVQGHMYESTAEVTIAIAAASSNPRIDRIVLECNWAQGNITYKVLQGVAASNPSAPTLTQNTAVWQIPLASIRVNANVSTITASNVTDDRVPVNGADNGCLTFLQTGQIAALAPSELRQVPILTGNFILNKGFTLSGNDLIVTESGFYDMTMQANWSGINQDVLACIYLRRVRKDGTYNDYPIDTRGPSGVSGNNGGFVTQGFCIIDCQIGDKLQFFVRHYDIGPRAIDWVRAKVAKISNL